MLEQLGEFKVLEPIGRGGMGCVYRGYQPSLDREVAIKVLSDRLQENPDYIARFQREARSAASLVHPNVIQIYTIGCEQGIHYFAMEYVRGKDLAQHLSEGRAFSCAQATEVVLGVTQALYAAYEMDIVHRDIKPSNIMLTERGHVKVMDFGLAKQIQSSLTEMGVIVGTANYMSPEQGQGKDLDSRSDLYSLGAVYYELVTGRPPFMAEQATAVLFMHVYEKPVPPRDLKPDVPAAMNDIIMRLLEKDPAARPASPDVLDAELRRVLQELTAPPPLRTAMPAGAPAPAAADKRPVILVVDGIRSVRRHLADLLEPEGFRVIEAEDGPDAVTQAVAERPVLILMDPRLPKMNGLDVMRQMRDKGVDARVMLMSPLSEREAILKAVDMEVSGFLGKPVNGHELKNRLRAVFRDTTSPAAALEAASADAPGTTAVKRHILLYDPSRYSQRFFQQVLAGAGHEVAATGEVEEALNILRQDPPDVVIVHATVGDVGARQIMDILARLPGKPPCLFVAGEGDAPVVEAVTHARLGPVIQKPVVPDQFLGAIDRLMDHTAREPKPALNSQVYNRLVARQHARDSAFSLFDFARLVQSIVPADAMADYEAKLRDGSARDMAGLLHAILKYHADQRGTDEAMRFVKHAYRQGDFDTRRACLFLMGRLLSPEAESAALMQIVGDEDHRIRTLILSRMGELRRPEFAEVAARFLGDDIWKVRSAAAECIEAIGNPAAIAPLVRALSRYGEDRLPRLRKLLMAARSAVEMREFDTFLRTGTPSERALVAGLFGDMRSPQLMAVLLPLLDDAHPAVRAAAASALGRIRAERALPDLFSHLPDAHPDAQRAVIEAILQFRLTPAAAGMLHALSGRGKRIAKEGADFIAALNRAPSVLENTLCALDRQTPDARKYASLLLTWAIPDERALQETVGQLASPDSQIRLRTARRVAEQVLRACSAHRPQGA